MHFLFLADGFEKIKPKGDSTLCLVRAALAKKHRVSWATDEDLKLSGFKTAVSATEIVECLPEALPTTGATQTWPLEKLDCVFIRKDPPFDESYVKLCWLLSLAERSVLMMNRPSLLLRYHEKLLPQEACMKGFLQTTDLIPTWLNDLEGAKEYCVENKVERIVTKPFFGFGGSDVNSQTAEDFLKTPALAKEHQRLVQPYQDDIVFGDFRVWFLDGKLLAHFVRVPKDGDFISNLAQGGKAVSRPLSPSQIAVCTKLGNFLKGAGIAMAGADLIGDKISEVNITSPTGLQSLLNLEGKNYGDAILEYAEHHVVTFPF